MYYWRRRVDPQTRGVRRVLVAAIFLTAVSVAAPVEDLELARDRQQLISEVAEADDRFFTSVWLMGGVTVGAAAFGIAVFLWTAKLSRQEDSR